MGQEQKPGRRLVLGAAVLGAAGAAAVGTGGSALADDRSGQRGKDRPGKLPVPAVVAHRGASGYRPEHTFGSYQLALDMGADVIEQDLVPTKDGHLVCRHENDITATTDVADHPEFADRKTTKTVDGTPLTGWFTEDFTLAELNTLRAKERIPQTRPHNTLYDGRWQVPAFEDVLKWADEQGRKRGRPVWLHIETKHPTYFRKLGLELEPRLAKLLRKYGRHRSHSPNFVQSFEPSSIQRLKKLVDCPGVCLLDAPDSQPWDFVEAGDPRTVADLVKPEGLKWMARFADGIGPVVDLVIPKNPDGSLGEPTTLVRDAHAENLVLHPYTMRNENTFLPLDFRKGTDPNAYGDAFGAFKAYFSTGIDGIFTDNPDTGKLAAADFRKG
ncbi:glycerophosphoryl diester phosphodiesterase [Streptomyces sp. WMMB 714]|jgi:glycerophosphoryl diester phosphodiesterase|uniref:glycerophosphodiester phosphodiesterase n=1 Tax=Streptomyces sp. WMMB 714 TaxID=1286822 RepID=UPI0005F820AE|nr:glycerophosphodiester phosphodiesterase [Streptomyces sp. WMMB 714]SCK42145.1 glycerophosphoryl diester phosphodiesterase [Streptomyces sp. WMMB 714]